MSTDFSSVEVETLDADTIRANLEAAGCGVDEDFIELIAGRMVNLNFLVVVTARFCGRRLTWTDIIYHLVEPKHYDTLDGRIKSFTAAKSA